MEIVRKVYLFLIDTVQTLLIAAAIFLVIYVFLFRPYQVSGQSMHPTFLDGEYILTNLVALHFEELKRGDVIVFHAPKEAEKDYIKRVVGLPGDVVSLRGGYIYVNDQKLDESAYLKSDVLTYQQSYLQEGQSIVVPEGEYFVVGDNRPFSSDSRDFGPIKRDAIIGKSFVVYWPPQDTRVINNPFEK